MPRFRVHTTDDETGPTLTREDHRRLRTTICLGVLSALLIFLFVLAAIWFAYYWWFMRPYLEPFP